ncbi:glycerophosphodiester phosphodiesterase [bacterium]|nr:glycerophosphodiester phosphodiesterase [bacterium]
MNAFTVFAHRGAAGTEPENTLRSFRKALACGAEWVELDVHSVEGVPVVFHDNRLNRRTKGSGVISRRPLEYVLSLDAGLGERIPLLDEVLSLLSGKAGVNIELKGRRTAEPVAALLADRLSGGAWTPEHLLVSSFDPAELSRFSRLMPQIRLGALFRKAPADMGAVPPGQGLFSLHLHKRAVSAEIVDRAHGRGLRVFVYTVNDPADAARLKNMGVDGVFTDFPERFLPSRDGFPPT